MSFQHLQDRQYYEDLYDEHTVEECRWYEEQGMKRIKEATPEKKPWHKFIMDISIWGVSGQRYEHKSQTVSEWMEHDRQRDELVENAVPPSRILCLNCGIYMDYESKHLHFDSNKKDERVLFIFRCKECCKGRCVFGDGEEWKHEPRCSKCGTVFVAIHSQKGQKLITDYRCSSCGATDRYELDFDQKEKKLDEAAIRRFRIDRERFCDAKKGLEYVEQKFRMQQLQELVKDMKHRKENKSLYAAVASLKKLSLMTMEKMLSAALKKQGYVRLKLGTPNIGRDVTVDFSIQDEKERGEYESRTLLQKTAAKALRETNWKLMSEGATYRLGVLSGRLKGVECEEELVKLVASRKKK